ncbi:LLM class flavin-dependent oxidoreductase [Sphingomonas sp. 37zxx]|uniref:LLM class flavin-dependent oxidoreductase n=1 Tax=Sphingomonas sp. 37zxx TaxID=1550073 RepID=UPI00053BECA3|nr:LLM class flavin-dependent oxidoreductase [Sphingomonas sp. 37zxx]
MTALPMPTAFDLPSDGGGKDLGVFLPMANGGWIMSKNAPPLDGSYVYNRKVAVAAEAAGLDFVMAMAKFKGYGGDIRQWESSLDSVVLMAALAEATSRVKVWTTIHTILQNPGVAAKMIATLDRVSDGRAGLNLVTGSYQGEFAQFGAWPEGVDHDGRYDLAYEWIRAIKQLWTQDSVTLEGKYFQLENATSWPKPVRQPFTVCAGTSAKGMQFTADEMDAIFLSGGDPVKLGEASRAAKETAARQGRFMRTYSMMTIVFGDTDAEAQATADHFRAGLDEQALQGMLRAYGFFDTEQGGKENAFVEKARSTFMAPYVLGTVDTVIDKLTDLFDVSGTDGLMLIFPDYLTGVPLFGQEVLPALRERFPGRVLVPSHG